jgi:hypothetical protein
MPPAHDVAVRDDNLRDTTFQSAVAVLAEVQQVRPCVMNDLLKILCGFDNSLLRILHPLERERSGMIGEPIVLHPGNLGGRRNTTEADQSYTMAAMKQTAGEFAGIRPDTADCISRN